jgi:hypothetical protein
VTDVVSLEEVAASINQTVVVDALLAAFDGVWTGR